MTLPPITGPTSTDPANLGPNNLGPAFTCLIPAYNEAPRIASMLQAVRQHPLLTEVIVIDDGSTDATARIAEDFGFRVIRTTGNFGKTRALVLGFRQVRTSHVLLLDADLIGLTTANVSDLIAPVAAGSATASLSLRGNAPRTWRLIGIDYISGERVLPMSLLADRLDALNELPRFGFEVYLNRLLLQADHRIAVVDLPNVASPSKASKRGLVKGLLADGAMLRDIFRTIAPVEALQQIRDLRRRRIIATLVAKSDPA